MLADYFIFTIHSQRWRGAILVARDERIRDLSDLVQGLVKPIVFAFIIATVGCYQGLNVKGGTEGVGRATTTAVVVSSVAILVADLFLSKLMLFLAGHVF